MILEERSLDLHRLLNLTRPLFVLDAETTGTDRQNDRIVELGFEQWTAEGLKREWRTYVNPLMPIPLGSIKTHGITDAVVQGCSACWKASGLVKGREGHVDLDHEFKPWPTFKQLAPYLVDGFKDCDYAGKNVRFDLCILAAEFMRATIEWSYLDARIIDAERLEQIAVPRSLSHLYKKYTGQELAGAHGALADAKASTVVIVEQLRAHQQLPRDLDVLHAAQWPGWIDGEGKFRFVDNVACFSNWGKHAGKPMKDVPAAYYDFILKGTFSVDVKKLAAEAKLGKFPQPKELT